LKEAGKRRARDVSRERKQRGDELTTAERERRARAEVVSVRQVGLLSLKSWRPTLGVPIRQGPAATADEDGRRDESNVAAEGGDGRVLCAWGDWCRQRERAPRPLR